MWYDPTEMIGKTWSGYRLVFSSGMEVEIRGFSEQDVRDKTQAKYGQAVSVVLIKPWGVVMEARERNGHTEFQLRPIGTGATGE